MHLLCVTFISTSAMSQRTTGSESIQKLWQISGGFSGISLILSPSRSFSGTGKMPQIAGCERCT